VLHSSMTRETLGLDGGEASSDLRDTALQRFELGRTAWPELALEFVAFERYFAGHSTGRPLPAAMHAADMYLACACAHGVDGAVSALERTCAADVARAVASIDSSPAFVDEVLQVTRERILVRKSDRPSRIGEYAGFASLKSWLRAVGLRCALSMRRRKGAQHHQPFRGEDDARLTKGGPEFEYLRARYTHVFEDAVRVAIERLPSKQRLLLRLNLVDGMSIDTLGTVYRVGRSTAARWLATARRSLLQEARREVRAKLRLTSAELDSLAAEVRSDLDVSILRLLGRPGGEGD
jgi:RNA polymerase sigma-70 factor (ECF subfamily)